MAGVVMATQVVLKMQPLKKIIDKVKLLDGPIVKVGILASSASTEEGISIIEIAAIQEFGTETIPARSFIRETIALHRDDINKMIADLAGKLVTTNMSETVALGRLGLYVVKLIKARITQGEGIPPPNAPSTIRQKGSDRPLVDTGQLLNNIAHEVIK